MLKTGSGALDHRFGFEYHRMMRFQSVDALRGLAALAVLFYHLWNRFYPGATSQNAAFIMPHTLLGHVTFFLFGLGYMGVNLFFVVSGFCIHLPQALKFNLTASDNLDIPRFAKRRFWRLYPAYLASLLWTSGVLVLLPLAVSLTRHLPLHLARVADLRSLVVSAFFLQQAYPRAYAFNGVYWTLSYELQFYLFYPLLLWCCRRLSFRTMLLVLLGVEIVMLRWHSPVQYLFLDRYFEWFLGMDLAERVAQRKPLLLPGVVTPLMFVVAVGSLFNTFTWPLHNLLTSIAFAVLLAWCLQNEPEKKWLTNEKLVALGVFSYSLYLVHIPMVDLCWNVVRLLREYRSGFPLWPVFACIPLSLGLGYVFYTRFEKPFLGKERKGTAILATGGAERTW